jgi:CHAT domain-containing protein
LLVVAAIVHGQDKPVEPPAPVPTTAVQELVDEAAVASNNGAADQALSLADRALALAQQATDVPGEAQAQRTRAVNLAKLDRNGEALIAWHDVEAIWKRIGDGPGQIEALGWQAVLEVHGSVQQGSETLQHTITQAENETRRPLAAVSALLDIGRAFIDLSRPREARQTYEAAVAVAEVVAPGSLEFASGQNGLGNVAFVRGDLGAALAYYRRAVTIYEKLAPNSLFLAGGLNNLGLVAHNQGSLSVARDYYQRALAIRETAAPNSLLVAASFSNLGVVARNEGDLNAARDYYQRALAIREKLAPNSLAVASSLNNLGNVARDRGELNAARDFDQRALAIQEQLAPDSLDVALSLNNLGIVARSQSDLGAAGRYYQRGLEIREKLAPNSLIVAASLDNLGLVAHDRGDLNSARDYHQRALAIREKLAPNSLDVATSLNNLGNVVVDQGDLSAARDYRQRSLAIREKLAPNSLVVASSLNNLGNVALYQGDLSAARDYQQRALAIRERLAPNSLSVATSLNNLAAVAQIQGDLSRARDYGERALAIQEKFAPNSLSAAFSLDSLGTVALYQGDLSAARDYHRRSLAIREKLAPNSIDVARSLNNLGTVAHDQGDVKTARDYDERSLAIEERLAPNSLDAAAIMDNLATLSYEEGDVASAAQYGAHAWAIVKAQAAAVTGDDARQAFQTQFQSIDSQLVRFQLALGHADDAFVTLEEGRAQALLQALTERGVARRLAPVDRWQRYELAQTASNHAGKTLETAGGAEAKATIALEAEIAQQSGPAIIQEKHRDLADREWDTEQARQAYTRARVEAERLWAEVRHTIEVAIPAPSAVADARVVLPQDTILAAFVVGDKESALFVVQRDGPVRAFALSLPLKELTARVDFVRGTVSREAGARGVRVQESDEVRVKAARDLYQKLFPLAVREMIGKSTRVVLSPDGVLWDLPFAALVINEADKPQYLGLEKPLVYAQSLTTLAQTIRAAAPTGAAKPKVLVIGNPLYDNALRQRLTKTQGTPVLTAAARVVAGPRAQGELALLSRDGEIPEPLPYAEEEAKQVAALYGVRASVGPEPTEAWFRQRAPDADIIHLATHGYFNPFRAVSSGLRLAVPEQEPGPADTDNDGALQAWEVFTQLQLHADLVVLSACQTGVGARVPGEGLVGLTRAFQVAGAASIVATQWRVADRSTARGMVALHQQLRKGLAKDEALRLAMRTLAADPRTAHPYYWAPFVLVGDFHPLRISSR